MINLLGKQRLGAEPKCSLSATCLNKTLVTSQNMILLFMPIEHLVSIEPIRWKDPLGLDIFIDDVGIPAWETFIMSTTPLQVWHT